MSQIKILVKNFSSLVLAQIASQICGFVVVVYLARMMGAAGFGLISFAQVITSYFLLATDLGITRLGTREMARDDAAVAGYAGKVISIRFILAIASYLILILFIVASGKPASLKWLMASFGLFLFVNSLNLDWAFRGIQRMEFIAVSTVIERIVYMLLVMVFVKTSNDIQKVPFFYLSGTLLSTLFLYFAFTFRVHTIRPLFEIKESRRLLSLSLPMALGSLMVRINNNFDSVLLGFMKTEEMVGWYSAAYKIILIAFLVGGFYITAIFPVASKYYRESLSDLQKLLSNSNRLLLGVSLPMAVGGVLLAQPIITLVFGTAYEPSIAPFRILLCYLPVSFISMVYADSLIACDCQKDYAKGVAFSAAVNIALNLILIPKFGMTGAASATLSSETILLLYSRKKLSKILTVEFSPFILKPLLSALAMGAMIMLIDDANVIFRIAIGIFCYVIFLIGTGGMSMKELRLMRSKLFRVKGIAS